MKRFHFFAKAVVFLLSLTPSFSVAQTTAYEQLTSIADIDENARYVLGLEGTGFHYSGTSSWGLVALPSVQSPIHYTLTKAADASCFTAKATISGTEYYLQIAWSSQSNTFSMGTTPNPSYDYNSLVIGTTCSGTPTPNYGVAHKELQSYHLRIYENNEHVPGLRTYHNTTGTMAYFYKEVTVVSTETELRAALDAYIHNIRLANNITLSNHISIYGGYTVTIDLDGHTLSRGLTEATYNGDVIEVYETASLTMMNGTLTGGYNNRTDEFSPGCIYNNGTVTLTDVTITGCKGDDGGAIRNQEGAVLAITGGAITGCKSLNHGGGAIVNYGTLSLTGTVSITGNTCHTNGGGIWNNATDATLNMQGTLTVKDNVTDGGSTTNIYLNGSSVITVTGEITSGSSIGLSRYAGAEEAYTYGFGEHHPSLTGPVAFFTDDLDSENYRFIAKGEIFRRPSSDDDDTDAIDVDGVLPGEFSVSATKKVHFSKGNLQAEIASYSSNVATASAWKLADNQYTYIGNAPGNNSFAVDTWVDLFSWVGASASNDTYGLITFSDDSSDSQAYLGNVAGESLKTDWGTAAASSIGLGWHTLTRDEWLYLFGMDTNNTDKTGHARYCKYFRATVNDVKGIVLLPDDISGISDIPDEASRGTASTYGGNTYTTEQWSALQSAGCVFLPAASLRVGTNTNSDNSVGRYWSSVSYSNQSNGYGLYFTSTEVSPMDYSYRYNGQAVRLVKELYTISYDLDGGSVATENPTSYTPLHPDITLNNPTKEGYRFDGWTGSNGSTPQTTVTIPAGSTGERTYTANWTALYSVTWDISDAEAANWSLSSANPFTEGEPLTVTYSGSRRVKSVKYIKVPKGAIKSLFTVNDQGKQVFFSKGNLQATYDGSAWSWAFAPNQWNYIGGRTEEGYETETGNNFIEDNGTLSANGTVDLFGWSTPSSNLGINNYTGVPEEQPYYTGYQFVDWGSSAEVQAGIGTGWFTMSVYEWYHIFITRASGATVNGTTNARYTHATINTDGSKAVNGMILFPDGVTIAADEATLWGDINSNSFWETKCTTAQWAALEAKGCVFLPAAGDRRASTVRFPNQGGYYWSSSPEDFSYSWGVVFSMDFLDPYGSGWALRYLGFSVRLANNTPADPIALTALDAENTQWQLDAMPTYDIMIQAEYYDEVTLTDGEAITALDAYAGEEIWVNYTRSFTSGKASTVCLPFAYTPKTGETFYTFTGITKDGSNYTADMTEYTGATLEANTPYLFMPTGDADFSGAYTIPAEITAGTTTSGDWTFVGTFETVEWTTAPTGTYGFSAQDVATDGITQGQFVKVGSYVRIRPMRAYLEYTGSDSEFVSARALTRVAEKLPETIGVRLIGANGSVTGIGTLNNRTGEVSFDPEAWYTLDGKRLNAQPTRSDIYVNNGKKVINK